MNITTDKVQVGESTTGTSTSTIWHCPYTSRKAEQGWECPRCGRINAPWKSQCDCGRNNYWTVTDDQTYKPYNDEWWKQVTCSPDTFRIHPESGPVWESPSSTCGTDSVKSDPNKIIYTTATNTTVGGSDYWDNMNQVWTNNPHVSNKIDPNTATTTWNNGPSTQTIHNGKTNYKE